MRSGDKGFREPPHLNQDAGERALVTLPNPWSPCRKYETPNSNHHALVSAGRVRVCRVRAQVRHILLLSSHQKLRCSTLLAASLCSGSGASHALPTTVFMLIQRSTADVGESTLWDLGQRSESHWKNSSRARLDQTCGPGQAFLAWRAWHNQR